MDRVKLFILEAHDTDPAKLYGWADAESMLGRYYDAYRPVYSPSRKPLERLREELIGWWGDEEECELSFVIDSEEYTRARVVELAREFYRDLYRVVEEMLPLYQAIGKAWDRLLADLGIDLRDPSQIEREVERITDEFREYGFVAAVVDEEAIRDMLVLDRYGVPIVDRAALSRDPDRAIAYCFLPGGNEVIVTYDHVRGFSRPGPVDVEGTISGALYPRKPSYD